MTLRKQGTTPSSVVVSSSVYLCEKCGHVEMSSYGVSGTKVCPKCDEPMVLRSSHTGTPEEATAEN